MNVKQKMKTLTTGVIPCFFSYNNDSKLFIMLYKQNIIM